jgi:hypothetical protein
LKTIIDKEYNKPYQVDYIIYTLVILVVLQSWWLQIKATLQRQLACPSKPQV